LNQVERGIEEALRNFAGREANGGELREITAGERIDDIGNMWRWRSSKRARQRPGTSRKPDKPQLASRLTSERGRTARNRVEGEREEDEPASAGVRRPRQKGEHRDARHTRQRAELVRDIAEKLKFG